MTKMVQIEQYCSLNNIKLTALRKRIIKILAQRNQPIGAYDVLNLLQKNHPKANIMSVYRVLDFLTKHHIVHKININQTYSLCCHPNTQLCQLLICSKCGKKTEMHSQQVNQALMNIALENRFFIQQNKIELSGLCQSCRMA